MVKGLTSYYDKKEQHTRDLADVIQAALVLGAVLGKDTPNGVVAIGYLELARALKTARDRYEAGTFAWESFHVAYQEKRSHLHPDLQAREGLTE